MGILKKALLKSATKTAERVAIRGINKKLMQTNSSEALVRKSQYKYKLIVKHKLISIKHNYIVTDENNNKVYQIKTDSMAVLTPTMRLFSGENTEVAYVTKMPTLFKHVGEYETYIENEHYATIYQHDKGKAYLELPLFDWRIEGDFLRWKFQVLDRNNSTVIQVRHAYDGENTYVLEYNSEEDEMLSLLLFMTVILAYHRKK